jgi:hypothetical protein
LRKRGIRCQGALSLSLSLSVCVCVCSKLTGPGPKTSSAHARVGLGHQCSQDPWFPRNQLCSGSGTTLSSRREPEVLAGQTGLTYRTLVDRPAGIQKYHRDSQPAEMACTTQLWMTLPTAGLRHDDGRMGSRPKTPRGPNWCVVTN